MTRIRLLGAVGLGVTVLLAATSGAAYAPAKWSRLGAGSEQASARIAFQSYRNENFDLYVMNADGGNQRRLTPTAGDGSPAWSPDGQRIAYQHWSGPEYQADIYVANPDGSGRRRLTRDPAADVAAVWSPDGRKLAFQRWLAPSDGGKVSFDSDVYVVDPGGGGERNLTGDATSFGPVWSPDGRKLAFASSRDGSRAAYVMNVDGSGTRLLTRGLNPVAWSPDGRKILVVRGVGRGRGGPAKLYLFAVDADGGGLRRLTRIAHVNGPLPSWSPDGRQIVFVSDRDGNNEVYVMNADGSGQRNLTRHRGHDSDPAWSPDGRKIAFTTGREGNFEIYVMNADGSGERNVTRNPAPDRYPAWSPGPTD